MPDYLNPFLPSSNKRSYILKQTKNCEITVDELDLEKSKNCGKIANEQIFIAFTYLWILFKFGIKSHKIEHTFKTHYYLKST